MVDKNLFMYDLAVVAIMKNEGPYIKEWLDYHLLAGVNHFYIYDNESPDNMKEILQPYIKAGAVTYIFYPGKARQYEAYNDAIANYRFFCRYMAFIDGDEFIFPQDNKSIIEVADEVLENERSRAGLSINWHQFGSNNLEKADYSKGVLERFTMRQSEENLKKETALVKLIANPRKLDYFWNPHFAMTYPGLHVVNENREIQDIYFNYPPTTNKIVINHYPQKSKEEYLKKVNRGAADTVYNIYQEAPFKHLYNDEFDDNILKYLDYRKKLLLPKSLRKKPFSVEKFDMESEDKKIQRIYKAVEKILFSYDNANLPPDFFQNNVENFLVCLAVSERFKFKDGAKIFSGYSLFWIARSMENAMNLEDILLITSTMPDILKLHYPIAENIRQLWMIILPKIVEHIRSCTSNKTLARDWNRISQLTYTFRLIESFDSYKK